MNYDLISRVGGRDVNEDSAGVMDNGVQTCFVVADGLGGHGQGDVASQLAVKAFLSAFTAPQASAGKAAESAFLSAQDMILSEQKRCGAAFQMKTTAAVLVVQEETAVCAHIGDTRLYRFCKNRVKDRTLDHSVPQMLVMAGEIKEKQIRYHPDRNRLLRVLGVAGDTPRFELRDDIPLRDTQAFLLCSDGFWELITEKEMGVCLRRSATAKKWLCAMTAIVEKRGENADADNYTAIAVML